MADECFSDHKLLKLFTALENDVAAAFNQSVKLLQDAGAKVIEVELPHTKYSLSTYYLIAPSEASSNLARYDGVHYGFRSVDSASVEYRHGWVDSKNKTVHRGTLKIPSTQIGFEKLKPLPQAPWINCSVHPPKLPTKTAFMIFDSNRYSVPETCVNTMLSVRSYPDKIEIYDMKGNMIAGHRRCFERNKPIVNLNHKSLKGISTAAKQERIQQLVRNLDPVVEQFLEINQEIGEGRYQSGYRIFKLLGFHSKHTVLSAIREAVKRKNCRMKFVFSCLEPRNTETSEPVSPQREELLLINYTPRSLEEYDK